MSADVARVALPTRRSTIRLARELAPSLCAGDLLVLSGPLGAGKTFFTRALCRSLGLPTSVRVTSPTFTLVHEFDTRPPIAHADLYRLELESEVSRLGLEEHRELGKLLVVEWGEPYVELLGGDALVLRLLLEPRRAELHPRGARGSAIVEAFANRLSAG